MSRRRCPFCDATMSDRDTICEPPGCPPAGSILDEFERCAEQTKLQELTAVTAEYANRLLAPGRADAAGYLYVMLESRLRKSYRQAERFVSENLELIRTIVEAIDGQPSSGHSRSSKTHTLASAGQFLLPDVPPWIFDMMAAEIDPLLDLGYFRAAALALQSSTVFRMMASKNREGALAAFDCASFYTFISPNPLRYTQPYRSAALERHVQSQQSYTAFADDHSSFLRTFPGKSEVLGALPPSPFAAHVIEPPDHHHLLKQAAATEDSRIESSLYLQACQVLIWKKKHQQALSYWRMATQLWTGSWQEALDVEIVLLQALKPPDWKKRFEQIEALTRQHPLASVLRVYNVDIRATQAIVEYFSRLRITERSRFIFDGQPFNGSPRTLLCFYQAIAAALRTSLPSTSLELGTCLAICANLAFDLSDLGLVERLTGEIFSACETIDVDTLTRVFWTRGRSCLARGRLQDAERCLIVALNLAATIESTDLYRVILTSFVIVCHMNGKHEMASSATSLALRLGTPDDDLRNAAASAFLALRPIAWKPPVFSEHQRSTISQAIENTINFIHSIDFSKRANMLLFSRANTHDPSQLERIDRLLDELKRAYRTSTFEHTVEYTRTIHSRDLAAAKEHAARLPDPYQRIRSFTQVGSAHAEQGEFDEAIACMTTALQEFRSLCEMNGMNSRWLALSAITFSSVVGQAIDHWFSASPSQRTSFEASAVFGRSDVVPQRAGSRAVVVVDFVAGNEHAWFHIRTSEGSASGSFLPMSGVETLIRLAMSEVSDGSKQPKVLIELTELAVRKLASAFELEQARSLLVVVRTTGLLRLLPWNLLICRAARGRSARVLCETSWQQSQPARPEPDRTRRIILDFFCATVLEGGHLEEFRKFCPFGSRERVAVMNRPATPLSALAGMLKSTKVAMLVCHGGFQSRDFGGQFNIVTPRLSVSSFSKTWFLTPYDILDGVDEILCDGLILSACWAGSAPGGSWGDPNRVWHLSFQDAFLLRGANWVLSSAWPMSVRSAASIARQMKTIAWRQMKHDGPSPALALSEYLSRSAQKMTSLDRDILNHGASIFCSSATVRRIVEEYLHEPEIT